jgi:hypothetical protein
LIVWWRRVRRGGVDGTRNGQTRILLVWQGRSAGLVCQHSQKQKRVRTSCTARYGVLAHMTAGLAYMYAWGLVFIYSLSTIGGFCFFSSLLLLVLKNSLTFCTAHLVSQEIDDDGDASWGAVFSSFLGIILLMTGSLLASGGSQEVGRFRFCPPLAHAGS